MDFQDFRKEAGDSWYSWKWQLQNRFTTISKLIPFIRLSREEEEGFLSTRNLFHFGLSPYYFSLIELDNPNCPIRKQVIPSSEELEISDYDKIDPLAEETHMPVKGVTHRYPDRVIWYVSHMCAVFCRYCTRKRKVGSSEHTPQQKDWENALQYFREHREIREVILSGGDPLSLSDSKLRYLLSSLKAIPHLNQVRIHTRYPVTLPFRITEKLCKVLSEFYPLYIVTHFNHSRECTKEAFEAIKNLNCLAHAIVLNQSVLLKGVNDTAKDLSDLHYGLIKMGVKPYYLHQCDEIYGTSHFRVPIEEGIRLMKAIRGNTSGICQPLYVVDLSGGGGKVPVPLPYLKEKREKSYLLENFRGEEYEIGL
ncbi:MAG: KamA family radical SAM protein [Leptospiraceae bacterium]|nr:KamA family radical SAM protein [Leptospiraceae bacterium]MCP5502497.1 KamA family radical SAM protein [Leptospiraceae bacterium]